jgi:alpha-tubulin suppressor-like RCC1 family protein
LYVCGGNLYGQLCFNTNGSLIFTQVPFPHKVQQVSCGDEFTAILTADHTVYLSGENSFGQLGNGNTMSVFEPVRVQLEHLGNPLIESITCGKGKTLMLTKSGELILCGWNARHQLGITNKANITVPQISKIPEKIKRIPVSRGLHTLAITELDGLYACGSNMKKEISNHEVQEVEYWESVEYDEVFTNRMKIVQALAGLDFTIIVTKSKFDLYDQISGMHYNLPFDDIIFFYNI